MSEQPSLPQNVIDAFHLMWDKWAFFTFKEDTSRLQAFHIMPNALGYIHPVEPFLWAKHYTLYHCTIIIVGIHSNPTTK